MKKVFFALIILLNIYIFSNITIPATISSNDKIFSLKDLIPNIENDRTLAFFSENTLKYESSKLKNIILSITDETDISFESTLITIMYEPNNVNGADSDNYDAENNLIENNLTENILKDYFIDMLYNESPNATINDFEISKYMKDTQISTILSLDYRRSMNNIFGNFLVLDETKLKKYISFKANVSNFDYVYVAKENIDFKTPLNNNILEKKLIDIYSLNMSPLKINDNNIMKYYANRTIRKGEIIFENSVKKIPDVSAGQVIPLEVYFDGVKVLSWVKVLNDALIGETIMARNEKTGVLINGKLFPGPKLIIDIGGY